MPHHKKRAAATLGALCLAATVQAEELKIGVHAALSGPGAGWGMAILAGAEFAAEDINRAGGLTVGGKNYTLKIVSVDDKYNPTVAVTSMNYLLHEHDIRFIMGPMGAASATATSKATTDKKVLTMVMAFGENTLGKATPYTFRPAITGKEFAGPQVKWLVARESIKTVTIVGPNNESGQVTGRDALAAYKAAGVSSADLQLYEPDRTDFTPLITRLMAQQVDAIDIAPSSITASAQIIKQARDIGFKGLFIRTGGEATADIMRVAGKAAEGLYTHQPVNPTDPKVVSYEKRYQQKYKGEMSGFSPLFYGGALAMFDAIKRANTVTDVDKVTQVLASSKDFESIVGKINWTTAGRYELPRQAVPPFYVGRVTGGSLRIVASCTLEGCN